MRARRTNGGGWVVCFDRREGPPGLTLQALPWTDATRFLVRWYPKAGKCSKYWATSSVEQARAALHKVQKGEDPCGFWSVAEKPAFARAREETARNPQNTGFDESEASRARMREEPVPAVPPAARIQRPAAPGEEVPFNQRVKELIRQRIPEEDVVETIRRGMNATKCYFTSNGEAVEVEDHATREKFCAMWMEYQVGKAAMEERAKSKKVLDEKHLHDLLLQSQAARDEMRALLDDIERQLAKGGAAA